jgi:hypothetical protein
VRTIRWLSLVLACAVAMTPFVPAAAEPLENDVRPNLHDQPQAQGLCFQSTVLFGMMAIGGGCYSPYLVRTQAGSYLGLALPGSPLVQPGQVIHLQSPAGQQLWGTLRYLLPLAVSPTIIPLNSMQTVPAQIATGANHLIVPMPGGVTRILLNFLRR